MFKNKNNDWSHKGHLGVVQIFACPETWFHQFDKIDQSLVGWETLIKSIKV